MLYHPGKSKIISQCYELIMIYLWIDYITRAQMNMATKMKKINFVMNFTSEEQFQRAKFEHFGGARWNDNTGHKCGTGLYSTYSLELKQWLHHQLIKKDVLIVTGFLKRDWTILIMIYACYVGDFAEYVTMWKWRDGYDYKTTKLWGISRII